MNKDLREHKLYNINDPFNEGIIMPIKFYSIILKVMYPFSYGNSRMCNFNERTKFINETKKNKYSKFT